MSAYETEVIVKCFINGKMGQCCNTVPYTNSMLPHQVCFE